jgi:ribosomal protein S11
MSSLGEAVMITWAEYGLKIENTSETTESLVIYVSVPEHSYKRSAKGSEMAAMDLAKRFKTVMTEMGVKRLTVKARVRGSEYWTKQMADSANIEMRKNIYGSQY